MNAQQFITNEDSARVWPTGCAPVLQLVAGLALLFGFPPEARSQCDPSPAGIVGWWSADGTTADLAGPNSGTLQNGASYAPGIVGQAFLLSRTGQYVQTPVGQGFLLSGTGQYVQTPYSPQWAFGTNSFTIELWANFASANGAGGGPAAMLSSDAGGGGNNKWIFWLAGGTLQFHINGQNGDTLIGSYALSPTLNQWYHLALTRQNSTYTFYANGIPVSTNTDNTVIPDSRSPLMIGQAEGGFFFIGLLDEVSIYKRALATNEIAAIYAAGSAGKCKTFPLVSATAPTNGATQVPASSTISATFTLPMNPASLNTNTFLIRDFNSNAVAGNVSYNAANLTAVFTPAQQLATNSGYIATITTAVAAANGSFLLVTYSWQFSIEGNSVIIVGNTTTTTPGTLATTGTGSDGLPDGWKLDFFGTTAVSASADSDGDGFSNLQEYLAGTDPLDSLSSLRIVGVVSEGQSSLVSFYGVSGKIYTIESRDFLIDTNTAWQARLIFTNATDGIVQVIDPDAFNATTNRFYRVVTGPNREVISDPAGFYSLPLSPGANALSVPLHKFPTGRGLVTGVSGNTVTVNGDPRWLTNSFAPANGFNQYILLVRKDTAANPGIQGDWWPISGNTGNAVTLNPGTDVIANFVVNGDVIEIRPLMSLKDLFGYGPTTILNKDHDGSAASGDGSKADILRFVSGTAFGPPIFYHDGSVLPQGYFIGSAGPLDGSTITVLPGQGFMLFRRSDSNPTIVVVAGQVQVSRLTQFLAPGPNAIGVPFASAAPLETSNLKESGLHLDHDGAAASGNASKADLMRPITGTSFGAPIFNHDGTLAAAGWYSGAVLNNNLSLMPGQAYIFFNKGPEVVRWREEVPYAAALPNLVQAVALSPSSPNPPLAFNWLDDSDGDGIPNWRDAKPNDPTVGELKIVIETPGKGDVINP